MQTLLSHSNKYLIFKGFQFALPSLLQIVTPDTDYDLMNETFADILLGYKLTGKQKVKTCLLFSAIKITTLSDKDYNKWQQVSESFRIMGVTRWGGAMFFKTMQNFYTFLYS